MKRTPRQMRRQNRKARGEVGAVAFRCKTGREIVRYPSTPTERERLLRRREAREAREARVLF
jgi:hypothetical protein